MTIHNAHIVERMEAAVSTAVATTTQIFVDRAVNAEVWDADGNRFIDFAAGIAVLNVGHSHPRVVKAAAEQLQRFTHSCFQVAPYESYVSLAEKLNKLTPGQFEKKTIFLSTGAEAVENAVKIARAATGRNAIIAFSGAFHGRTFMSMALTGKVAPYKRAFGTMPAGVFHVPFPVDLHEVSVQDTLKALDALFRADVDPHQVAAIIVEPVQGEGGFYPAPTDLMRAIREICDKHGIVMIADEVQTGFARTGRMFAMQHHDVSADIVTMAKSLAGGFPLSAVTGRADLMEAPKPGGLGGTYGGNPISLAAAHAVLDIIEDEGLCERAECLGRQLRQKLKEIAGNVPEIADVRGLGLMNAIEFSDPKSKRPNAELANAVRLKALDKGLILLLCGVYGNVIRFLPPITVEDGVFEEALGILEAAILECVSQHHS